MAVSILFFIWLSVDGATLLRDYNKDVPVHLHAPEEPYTWITWAIFAPDTEHGIWGAVSGSGLGNAPYMGQLIAGQAEFPWLVDVRSRDHDQEGWGIGNLVSSKWVVTAGHLSLKWGEDDRCGPSETGNYQVLFCTNYINEDWKYFDLRTGRGIRRLWDGRDQQGTRTIAYIMRHPECTRWSREWDLMMLRLNLPIDPIPPVIGYMPIWGSTRQHASSTHIPAVHLVDHVRNNVVCYVATFGRVLYNVAKPPTLDFKIKYRVYWTPWLTCENQKRSLCSTDLNNQAYIDETCEFFFSHGAEDYGNHQYECFELRSGEGAVCDHDVGAPLVCGSEVAGFVVRGAPYLTCKSGRPYPFVITKIDQFGGGFFDGSRPPPIVHVSTPSTPWPIQPGGNGKKWEGPTPIIMKRKRL